MFPLAGPAEHSLKPEVACLGVHRILYPLSLLTAIPEPVSSGWRSMCPSTWTAISCLLTDPTNPPLYVSACRKPRSYAALLLARKVSCHGDTLLSRSIPSSCLLFFPQHVCYACQ